MRVIVLGEKQKLILTYDATVTAVPAARHEIVAFAAAAGATPDELDTIRLAASEALTNAVVHAYGAAGGRLHVSAAIAGDEVWVLVGDDGAGLHAGSKTGGGLGVGLALIADLTDSFAIVNRSSGGTEVRMRFKLESTQRPRRGGQSARSSACSAARPASSIFSTTR